MHIYNAKDRVTLTVIVDQVQHGSGQLELCIKISHPDKIVEISGYNTDCQQKLLVRCHLCFDQGSKLCKMKEKEFIRRHCGAAGYIHNVYIISVKYSWYIEQGANSSPSTPILPSPSESPAFRKAFVSASVSALAPAEKFCRNSLKSTTGNYP